MNPVSKKITISLFAFGACVFALTLVYPLWDGSLGINGYEIDQGLQRATLYTPND